jgi:hypothetical protein
MHLGIAIWAIIAAWRWGDWKHWQRYQSTMLYFAAGNLLYNYFTSDFPLWHFNPDFLINHKITEVIYTFIVFPATVLLFLSRYPQSLKHRIYHIAQWILIYSALEWIGQVLGKIEYHHNWNFWWSVAFNCITFPMLRLHYVKPLAAFMLSVLFTVFFISYFQVPINK